MKRGEGSLRQVRGIFYIDRAPERGFRPHGERMGAMDTDQITVPNDSPVLIGLRIRDARMQRHLKPEALAGQLGISKAHLCNIEYGRKVPSLELIISVAHALAVSLDYLLLGMERALEMGLKNVYFLSLDAAELEEYFAPGEIDLLYLNFCDPWPRKKNAKRRLTFRSFLEKYKKILRDGGEIHFKTDNAPLFEWSLGEFEACGLEIRNLTRDLHANGPVGIMTGYEEKFYQLGTPINRCELVSRRQGNAEN